jgi:PKD repeat protein
VHRYTAPGTYTAKVTVTDTGGETATDEIEITVVNSAPTVQAGVSPRSGVAPHRVRFTSEGRDADGDRLTYAWAFGDGGTADTRNASHTYLQAGTYTAEVTVTDVHGGTGSAEVQVTVANPPGNAAPTVRVAADPKTGTAPLRVRFTSAASDPDRDQLSYVWEFGDGAKAGGPTAVHTYTQPGSYTAKLTVTDPGGRTASATVVVTASQKPAPKGAVAGEQAERPRPRLALALAKSQSVRRVIARGLRLKVTCERACRVSSVLRIAGRKAERLGGTKTLRLRAGQSRTILVRLDRRVRKRLPAAMREADMKRLKATVITKVKTDAGTQTLRKQIVLKR